jgi:hypothetical protein
VFTGFLIFSGCRFVSICAVFFRLRGAQFDTKRNRSKVRTKIRAKPRGVTCFKLKHVLPGTGQLLKFITLKAIVMTTKSFGILFYLKSRTGRGDSPCDIYLRVSVNGGRHDLSLQRKCAPSMWNRSSGRATGKKEQIKALNAYLDTIEAKVHEARHLLIQLGRPVTSEYIKDILRGQTPTFEKKHLLMELFQEHNTRMQALVGKEYAAGTQRDPGRGVGLLDCQKLALFDVPMGNHMVFAYEVLLLK